MGKKNGKLRFGYKKHTVTGHLGQSNDGLVEG